MIFATVDPGALLVEMARIPVGGGRGRFFADRGGGAPVGDRRVVFPHLWIAAGPGWPEKNSHPGGDRNRRGPPAESCGAFHARVFSWQRGGLGRPRATPADAARCW